MPTRTRERPAQPERPAPPVSSETALINISHAFDREANAIANLLAREGDVGRYRELFLDVVSKDAKLLRSSEESLIRSIRDMAKLDLEPVLGEAYLVPFWNTKASRYEATLIIGYEGLKTLAFRSGFVTMIEGDVRRENDEFVYVRGHPETILRHVPADHERGEILGAWSMIHLRDAPRPLIAYLPIDRIEQRRRVSASGTNRETGEAIGIWRDWYEEQAAKTALRFNLKLAPKSVRQRVADALAIEDAVDSLLLVAGDAPKSIEGKTGTPRRRRMMARLTGGAAADEPAEGDDAVGSPLTEPDAEVAHESASGESASGDPGADRQAAKSEGTGMPTCGDPSPYGDDLTCGLPADHLENRQAMRIHRALDGSGKVIATWPADKPKVVSEPEVGS